MKQLLLLALCLITLSGCITETNFAGQEVSIFFTEISDGIGIDNAGWLTKNTVVSKYERMTSDFRAEAMNVESGIKVFYGGGKVHPTNISQHVLQLCESKSNLLSGQASNTPAKCVLSREQDKVIYRDLLDYKNQIAQIKKRDQSVQEKRRAEILASLVDRCMNFGWNDDDQISACVQQESYRDLQLARQKREIASLERRLASATKVEEKPFYLEALEILTEEAKNRENQQMKLDIAKLKGKVGIR
ncbi:MAG: hypothetical protein P8H52_00125 [Porticoccaceae bacterium]|nr:hypothetical protein [Porticoccaceae bacterium]